MLTPEQVLRIAGAELVEAHGKAPFEEGQHAVDAQVSLHLIGSVEQTSAQLVTPTVQVPLAEMLAFLARKLGVGAERLHGLVMEAAADALCATAERPMALVMAATDALLFAKQQRQAALPKQERGGPLRRIVQLSEVQVRPIGAESVTTAPAPRKRAASRKLTA